MNTWRKITILAQALARLSPRMAVYMARRVLRNLTARSFPKLYKARLQRIEAALPTLRTAPSPITPGLQAMAEFYIAEYREMMEGVLSGSVLLHGRTIDFGGADAIDWTHRVPEEGDHQMWRVKLAHMGFLCPMMCVGGPRFYSVISPIIASAKVGADVTAPGAFHGFWFPYAASHRMLALGSGLLFARAQRELPEEVDRAVTDFLRYTAAFVLDNIEHELNNNHVERNLAALCLYFSHTEEVPPTIAARLERDVSHLIDTTYLADGCQVERSPMYQGLGVASLGVIAEAPFLSEALRSNVRAIHTAAEHAFAAMCHPDGEVALFNDAWHGEVPRWSGPPAPAGRRLFEQGGYGRLEQDGDLCLLDAGPLGPSWNPGHGHADFLSVEITLAGQRLIVDPGTSRYNTGSDRARERSAAAHNGPRYIGHEPIEFLGCFKVGRLTQALLLAEEKLPERCIGGLFQSSVGSVARLICHYPDAGFVIVNTWDRTKPDGAVDWLIPANWQVRLSDDKDCSPHTSRTLILSILDQEAHISRLDGGTLHNPSPDHWAHRYGRRENAHGLHMKAQPNKSGQSLMCWVGRTPAPPNACKDAKKLHDTLVSYLHA